MAKTKRQTGDLTIKKEEEEDRKPTLLLNGVNSTTTNKITKRKPSQNKNGISPTQEIKVEEDTDTKSLLKLPPKLPKGQRVSQEQINRLTGAIVNDNMSIREAACAVKLSCPTARYYYNEYKNDPENNIPLPRNQCTHPQRVYTQEQVENLIRYINEDKMSIKEASAKANMNYSSGYKYYNTYLQDPDHNIPISRSHQSYTQDQKDEFVGYIVNDKTSITAASKKAKMSATPGKKYYHKYFNEQNPDIATPSHITTPSRYTQEQINELISYIVDDKMSITAASKKVNMSVTTGHKYYTQYLKEHNLGPLTRRCTRDKINQIIRYIVDDKMSITAASKKVNMSITTGWKYYQRYLKEHNLGPLTRRYTQDQINQLISYIVDDKMSITAASKKVNMGITTGWKYYQRYLKEHNLGPLTRRCTQDQINQLISYIVDDKMSITAASKKANMKYDTAYGCYHRYLKYPKHDAPTRRRSGLKNE